MTIFVLELKKIESDNETKNNIFHSNSKAETIVNESDTDNVFESPYIKIKHPNISWKRFRLDY